MTTARPNRLGLYADVKEILDAALTHDGGSYELSDYGKAVHWRQRAYKFRKLYAETLPPKELSPYDRLTIPRIEEGSNTVVIVLQKTSGTFTPNASPIVEEINEVDDLLGDALALAARLGKGEAL